MKRIKVLKKRLQSRKVVASAFLEVVSKVRDSATHRQRRITAGLSLILLFATLIKSATSWHVASRAIHWNLRRDYRRRLRRENGTKADTRVRLSYMLTEMYSRACMTVFLNSLLQLFTPETNGLINAVNKSELRFLKSFMFSSIILKKV